MQTLAQELRGDRFVAPDRGQERLEPAGTASAGSVQGVEHAGVMRRRHAVGDECVEHRGSVVEAPDDGGEVGSRIPSAAFGRAHRPQHGGATGKRRAVERIDARLRDDGVEHHPRHVGGVLQRVALGHERAVGDAIERQPANPQRRSKRFDVGDGVGRRVVTPGRTDRARARGNGCRWHDGQIRGAGRLL